MGFKISRFNFCKNSSLNAVKVSTFFFFFVCWLEDSGENSS